MMDKVFIIGGGVAIVFLFIALGAAAYALYRKIRNSKIIDISFRNPLP